MGLESRDYIRDSRPPTGFGGGTGLSGYWAVKFLLIANIVVFLFQLGPSRVTDWLDLRMATQVGPEGARFFEPAGREGKSLLRIAIPDEDLPGFQTIPAGAIVKPLGEYADENGERFWKIEWQGRIGMVRSRDIRPAPLRSWQLSWRLVTYGFCHGGFEHILFNMLVLFFFGRMVEPLYGSKEFLLFFLCGVVIAGLGHVAFETAMRENVPAVGASGGVMAVVFLTAMIYPRSKWLLMFVIPVELRFIAIGYAVFDLLGVFSPGSGIAHAAHLGGAAFGVAYRHYRWNITGLFRAVRDRFRFSSRPRRNRNVRLHRPPAPSRENLEHKVDELLEKISKQGEASLTDSEREFLADASRRYRDR